MPKIKRLAVQNFKAFAEEQEFLLNGKHMLVYGENGSGKSSLFWALHVLLQSSIQGKNSTKYFDPTNPENLLNRFAGIPLNDTKVSIEYVGGGTSIISPSLTNNSANATLSELNLNSDFINHKQFSNLSRFTNRQTANFFPVLLHDILPFWHNQNISLEVLYKSIIENPPYWQSRRNPNQLGRYPKNTSEYNQFEAKIRTFNNELVPIVDSLQQGTNQFIQDHFNQELGRIRVLLNPTEQDDVQMIEKLKFDDARYTKGNASFKANRFRDFFYPFVPFYLKDQNGIIQRPHAFLNEAKLIAIALSMRLATLPLRPVAESDNALLVLDDMLISLDMGHRQKVLEILFSNFLEKYQLIVLTHDRAFYGLVKRFIDEHSQKDKWESRELYVDRRGAYNKPYVNETTEYMEKAKMYLEVIHDYPAAANYMRKEAESLLKEILPEKYKYNEDYTPIWKLSKLIKKAREYFKQYEVNMSPFQSLDNALQNVLNPMSHDDMKSQLFYNDLNTCYQTLQTIEELKELQIQEILIAGSKLEFELTQGADVHKYLLILRKPLILKKEKNELSKLVNQMFNVKWFQNGDYQQKFDDKKSLKGFYEKMCQNTANTPASDFFSIYKLDNGNLLQTLRTF